MLSHSARLLALGAVLLATACGSEPVGKDKASASTDDTGTSERETCGEETGPAPYTVVPLDEGDYSTLTPSTDTYAGWGLGETLALMSDLGGDGRPEVVSSGYYYFDSGYAISTTYIFDSGSFSTGPKAGVAQDEARLQIDTENGGAPSYPYVIGDIDGDGLDELALDADGWGASSILVRGEQLATLSGKVQREDIDRNADMTFTNCPGGFAFVYHSGYLSDAGRSSPDLVVDCYGDIVVAHTAGIADGNVKIADEGQVRIYNTDTWGGEPIVEWDRLFKPNVLGDLDGDGLDELVIPLSTRTAAYNYIYYGDSLDFDSPTSIEDADVTLREPDTISWGEHIIYFFLPTPLGDVDGDGVADVLWSTGYAQVDDREDLGMAWLWSGYRLASPMVGDVGDADVTFTADLPYSYVGASAADAGDVDGDCLSDVLISGLGVGLEGAQPEPSTEHLVRGAELLGGGTYNLVHAGVGFRADYGAIGAYAAGEDLDGDRVADLLIGMKLGGGGLGRIWMIPGGTLPL